MLKTFAILVVLLSAVLGGSSFARPPDQKQYGRITQSKNTESQEAQKKDDPAASVSFFQIVGKFLRTYDKEIEGTSVATIAAFTIILGVSTCFLWCATRRAALAAKEAAEDIPIVERAYVYPRIVEEKIFEAIINVQNGLNPNHHIPRVYFTIKNYGKTAAFIAEIHGYLTCVSDDFVARDSDDWHISYEVALEPNGTTETFSADLRPQLTKKEANGIVNGIAKLKFYGSVSFEDVWGDKRFQPFSWTWNHTKRRMVSHIPDTYEKSKK